MLICGPNPLWDPEIPPWREFPLVGNLYYSMFSGTKGLWCDSHCWQNAHGIQQYVGVDFEVFAAQGWHCTDVWLLLHAIFHPYWWKSGVSPQYLNSVKIGNINAPLRHIHCSILTKFSGFVGSSVVHPCFTFCQMYLGFQSYVGRWSHHGMLKLKIQSNLGVFAPPGQQSELNRWNLAISHAKFDPDGWSIMGTGAPKIQNLSNFRFFASQCSSWWCCCLGHFKNTCDDDDDDRADGIHQSR